MLFLFINLRIDLIEGGRVMKSGKIITYLVLVGFLYMAFNGYFNNLPDIFSQYLPNQYQVIYHNNLELHYTNQIDNQTVEKIIKTYGNAKDYRILYVSKEGNYYVVKYVSPFQSLDGDGMNGMWISGLAIQTAKDFSKKVVNGQPVVFVALSSDGKTELYRTQPTVG